MCDQGVAGSKGRGCTCRGIPAFIILLLAIMAIMMMIMVSIDGNDDDDEYFTITYHRPWYDQETQCVHSSLSILQLIQLMTTSAMHQYHKASKQTQQLPAIVIKITHIPRRQTS